MENEEKTFVVETKATTEPEKRPIQLTGIEKEEQIRKKRRKIKIAGAPKAPHTGYVRYMNERREILRKEFPNKTAIEHTKIIGEEWSQLSDEKKLPYMKAAESDREKYTTDLHHFLKTNPGVLENEIGKNKVSRMNSTKSATKDKPDDATGEQKEEKECSSIMTDKDNQEEFISPKLMTKDKNSKRKRIPTPTNTNTATTVPTVTTAGTSTKPVAGEVPIFTTEFLEHNKYYDMELRNLRKSKSDLEQQNAVLEKHVENMKFGVEKMTLENDQLEEKNRLLEIYLDKLKRKLANALSGLAIPSEPNGATYENIDKYMDDLYKMATSNLHGPASLNKAKDIIRKLDLQIQF